MGLRGEAARQVEAVSDGDEGERGQSGRAGAGQVASSGGISQQQKRVPLFNLYSYCTTSERQKRCAFRPPRVVFVLGLVSLNSLTSGKKTKNKPSPLSGFFSLICGFLTAAGGVYLA